MFFFYLLSRNLLLMCVEPRCASESLSHSGHPLDTYPVHWPGDTAVNKRQDPVFKEPEVTPGRHRPRRWTLMIVSHYYFTKLRVIIILGLGHHYLGPTFILREIQFAFFYLSPKCFSAREKGQRRGQLNDSSELVPASLLTLYLFLKRTVAKLCRSSQLLG